MKKTIITVFAVLILSTSTAFAGPAHGRRGDRDGEGPGKRAEEHMTRMFDRLDLSEAQRTQIMQLRDQMRAEAAPQRDAMQETMQALRDARQSGDQARIDELSTKADEQRAEMDAMRESHHARLLEILTPEQQEQFKAMMDEHPGRGGQRPRPRARQTLSRSTFPLSKHLDPAPRRRIFFCSQPRSVRPVILRGCEGSRTT